MKFYSVSLILTLILSMSLSAEAQSLAERFNRIDRNGDGKVTTQELPRAELFQRLDRNGDGVIERSEILGAGTTTRTQPRSAGVGDLKMPEEPAHTPHLNLRYDEIEGVAPNLLSLDLYVPEGESEPRPVMIMIHGGGWRKGDKASPPIVGAKMRHFVGAGYIYASLNYRLSPETPTDDGVKHPTHAQDCAKAIAWIHDRIAEHGGDPDQLHLMGHSAGGHLAAILGTNEGFLKAEGKDLSILKTNILLDPAAIDIPGYLESVDGRGMTALYQLAFGTDDANLRDASPQDHVEEGKGIPPTLLFFGGDRMALDQFGPAFAKSLTEAGSPSQAVDTVTLDHGQINSHIGLVDEPMTKLIMRLHAGEKATMFPKVLGESGESKIVQELDVAYGKHAAQRLDLYRPTQASNAPVMVYIHGGGWKRGDKRAVGEKARFFCGRGWLFVSVNYRLLPEGKHPANVQDVALALAWVHDHAGDYGGDPTKLFVMGHSAGAHLVALVGTNPAPLQKASQSLAILKGVIPLDTNAYDIAKLMQSASAGFYGDVFGDDQSQWKDASPLHQIASDQNIPPFLICYSRGLRTRANPVRPAQANAFADALRAAGIEANVIDASDRNHGEINAWFGKPDDEKVTGAAMKFLDAIVERKLGESEASASVDQVRFTRDYVAGTRDPNGEFMGGTETMRIVAHDGKLFAGNGYWTDQPGDDPRPGAQILVKRGRNDPWEVSQTFPGAARINAMETVTFTTEYTGKKLDHPVAIFVADAGLLSARSEGPLFAHVHNDETGEWERSKIRADAPRAFVRAFGFHRDSETGIEHIFAGTGGGEVYRGACDTEAPGGLRWNPEPEYANPDFDGGAFKRCQGFCIANGKLYASVAPRLLERSDGPDPKWKEVFRWNPKERAGAGLRGITAIPALDGEHEVIIGSREQEGRILRIDPVNDYKVTDELRSQPFLKEQLGSEFRGGKLVAYNRFIPGKHPQTGEPIHWLTVAGFKAGDRQAAWLLIRHADATYEPVRVFDPALGEEHPLLISTRTFEFSPWSEKVFYTGGFDGAANNRKNHNSAWIFRGEIAGGEPQVK